MISSKPAPAQDPNPGSDLHLEWLDDLSSSDGPLLERAAEVTRDAEPARQTSDDGGQGLAAALVEAVRMLDLTSLGDSDTDATTRELCTRALDPLPGLARLAPRVAAVCIFDRLVPTARKALDGHGVRVAAVTAGFPHPHPDLERRLDEVRATVEAGADEIDLVITRRHALAHDWEALYEEVRALRAASTGTTLKVILAAGDLGTLHTVGAAGLVCCMAGADFIKTSTGREAVNATPPIGLAMAEAIASFARRTGFPVGFKAAGGIREARQALMWLQLVESTLGRDWIRPDRLRIGASSLLDDVARVLASDFGRRS